MLVELLLELDREKDKDDDDRQLELLLRLLLELDRLDEQDDDLDEDEYDSPPRYCNTKYGLNPFVPSLSVNVTM